MIRKNCRFDAQRTFQTLPVMGRRPALRDPDDERILEVAAQCRGIIVTHNKRHFVEAERFRIPVKTPAEFLEMPGVIQWT